MIELLTNIHLVYWVTIIQLMVGLFIMMTQANLFKKMIGLSVFQTAVILLYVAMGKIEGGTAPVYGDKFEVYSNPLPHVLMLTAIVVGLATLAVGLALIVRIYESYGTIEENEIQTKEQLVS